MSDPGTRATVRGVVAVEKRLRKVYGDAKKEIERIVRDFNLKFAAQDKIMQKKVANNEITEQQYKDWLMRTVYSGKRYDEMVNHCAEVLASSNRQALNIVRGAQIDVLAENMNFQEYALENGLNVDLSFGVYSRETVGLLLKKQPELLPRKVLNGRKDKAWNKDKIANIVSQSIIQGDGIDAIATAIGEQLAVQNDSAMTRYARTAMTSAQNAGRMEMMKQAEKEGIKSKKKWLATLDSRTRDAHQELDLQTADIDEPFVNKVGKIMFPGDPNADPANVYNCRCTLIYEVDGQPLNGQRRAYKEWDDEKGHHRKSYLIDGNISYSEWKKMKEK